MYGCGKVRLLVVRKQKKQWNWSAVGEKNLLACSFLDHKFRLLDDILQHIFMSVVRWIIFLFKRENLSL